MDPQVLGYDDNGKPIVAAGVVGFDDNGKPIAAGPASTAPHTGADYYWQAVKDFGTGLKTSAGKTLDALNPFADGPPRPTREQEAARLEAQLKNAPPLNFDPRVSGRAVWKGVTSLTAKDVGEGVGDIGQMYLMGKAAGAVEPETVRGVINTTGRAVDAVGRGTTAVGDATMSSAPAAVLYSALSKSPGAAAVAAVPPLLKFGGKGISAIGRAMQSEPPPPAPEAPFINPYATRTGSGLMPAPTGTPNGPTGGGADVPAAPSWENWAAPARTTTGPVPPPPPIVGERPVVMRPGTTSGAPAAAPTTGNPGWEGFNHGVPTPEPSGPRPVVMQPGTTSGAPAVAPTGGPSWDQWTPGRGAAPVPEPPPVVPPAAGAAPVVAPPPEPPPSPNAIREQLIASLVEKATQQAKSPEGVTATEGVKPPPSTLDPEAQAVRDQTAARPAAEGESTIPSREQMTPDELSRAREGGRDSPDRQKGETLEDYRLRTRGRATGEQSAEPSIIPSRRSAAIDDTIESMYERNATDQEFRDYLAKSKNHPKKGEIAAKIESKAHSYKRPSPLAHVIAGAVATGAMLRKALVGQLQGDDKQQEQD